MSIDTGATVLVIGAGPTGLMMAAELKLHGVSCRIIDKEAAASDKSKALAIHARTLEILESLGLADQFVGRGQKLLGMHVVMEGKPVIHATFDRIPSRYPYVLSLPQSETERILAQHLEKLEVQVERKAELIGLTQDADAVIATVRRADGAQEHLTAPYLIGCDGAHSAVRQALGLRFEGMEYEELFVLADVQISWEFGEDEARAYLSPEGTAAYFPMGGGRYRIIVQVPPGTTALSPEPTLAETQALVDRFGPSGATLSDPHWLAAFRIHRRKVPSYRDRRVFVVGDVAHIHSPVGWHGMNTGIQDAHNLAWKLALVIRGAAAPALLDSFQAERHPVAEQVLRTTDTMTRIATVRNPLARALRDFLMPVLVSQGFVQKRFTRSLAELAVNYHRSPIVAQARPRLRDAVRQPGLGAKAWWAFSTGPRPGDRAPDAAPLAAGERTGVRLHQMMDPVRHNLMLLRGIEPALGVDIVLQDVAEMIADGFGSLVAIHLIVIDGAPPQSFPAGADRRGDGGS
ncbi:MAG TPA: FAD-dependent monooxygenase, partial [Candidatus Binataceae bacterium]